MNFTLQSKEGSTAERPMRYRPLKSPEDSRVKNLRDAEAKYKERIAQASLAGKRDGLIPLQDPSIPALSRSTSSLLTLKS